MKPDPQALMVVDMASKSELTPLPPQPPDSNNEIVEYKKPELLQEEEEDLEIKLRRILENVPVRISNTFGSSAGSSSCDFHQCGMLGVESLSLEVESYNLVESVDMSPSNTLSWVGNFKKSDHEVVCWGFRLENSTRAPEKVKFFANAAGDYFTCGVVVDKSSRPICWGLNFPPLKLLYLTLL